MLSSTSLWASLFVLSILLFGKVDKNLL